MKNQLTSSILLLALAFLFGFPSVDFRHVQFRFFHHLLTIKHTLVFDHQQRNLSAAFRAAENVLPNRSMDTIDLIVDVATFVKERRKSFRVEIVIPYPRGCQSKRQVFQSEGHSVETYWLDYRQNGDNWNSDHVLVYLHGGGYILGDFQSTYLLLILLLLRPSPSTCIV